MGFGAVVITASLVGAVLAAYFHYLRKGLLKARQVGTIGFFHPYTNDGGGGEKVLWCAVRTLQEACPAAECVIYSGDDASPESLARRALDLFGVKIERPVGVVRLLKRGLVDASTYPHFTLIGQSLGSVGLAWEAFEKLTPGVFVDTAGYAFTYPLAHMMGSKVATYTHYPTVSTDMLDRVCQRKALYNNNSRIATSALLSWCKVLYYRLFALVYGFAGRYADVIMVNSGWTEGHIASLWKCKGRIAKVYPPCDTSALQVLPLERPSAGCYIVSVSQFRPEKNHALQLQAFALALEAGGWRSSSAASSRAGRPRLKLVGSVRHAEDERRVELLGSLAAHLGIEHLVDFCVNVSHSELKSLLGGAVAGLHTMVDEHFGISVVEYMAAGAIPIAHNSGGPREDIVVEEENVPTGFLATTEEEFARRILTVLEMTERERLEIAAAARKRSMLFSEGEFSQGFRTAMEPVLANFQ